MMTRESGLKWFELSDHAADADYSAYNYMVLTTPDARERIPAHETFAHETRATRPSCRLASCAKRAKVDVPSCAQSSRGTGPHTNMK